MGQDMQNKQDESHMFEEYFGVTTIFVLLLSPILSIILIFWFPDLFWVAEPVLAFILSFIYAYFMLSSPKVKKPDSMADVYKPVLFPMLYQLFLVVLFNFFGSTSEIAVVVYFFLSFNWYGGLAGDGADWHFTLFLNALYYLVLTAGFISGERLAARKSKTVYRKINKKKAGIIVLCCLSVYLLSEFVLYHQRINILKDGTISYGFRYENGLSSIDLSPYYVENEENILAGLNEESDFIITVPDKMPILDGAEAAYPIYSAFAAACYQDIDILQKNAKDREYKKIHENAVMPIRFTNTIQAYEKLLEGEVDIFFGARPSKEQLAMAQNAGKELVLTPIGKEGFVFFVSTENPVDSLTSTQIRDIYSGKINNWHSLGGERARILAFQRPANSGSQTMMEYFMGDIPLREPLEVEYTSAMLDTIQGVAEYQNNASSIGYSFRYYASIMALEEDASAGIKFLAVDGIYPDEANIRQEKYPLTTELYAITCADNPNKYIGPFLQWMTGIQGQKIISDTGYISLESSYD